MVAMSRQKLTLTLLGALVIIIIAGSFFFYVDSLPPAPETRVEEPYRRTDDKPPSAVEDETSHPALRQDGPGATQPTGNAIPAQQ